MCQLPPPSDDITGRLRLGTVSQRYPNRIKPSCPWSLGHRQPREVALGIPHMSTQPIRREVPQSDPLRASIQTLEMRPRGVPGPVQTPS